MTEIITTTTPARRESETSNRPVVDAWDGAAPYPTIAGCHLCIWRPLPLTNAQEEKLQAFIDEHSDWEDGTPKEQAPLPESDRKPSEGSGRKIQTS